jgi:hypothetical protein
MKNKLLKCSHILFSEKTKFADNISVFLLF